MPENINLFTHLRLDDFVTNFKNWYNSPDNPINPESSYSGNDYDYVSFIPSPDAIYLIDIGRIPLDITISKFFKLIMSQTNAGNTVSVNTPLGWKMQLGKKCSDIKKIENQKINDDDAYRVSPGYQKINDDAYRVSPGYQKINDNAFGVNPGYQNVNHDKYTVTPGLFGQAITLKLSNNGNSMMSPSPSVATSAKSPLTFNDLGISQQNFLDYIDLEESSWINAFSQPYETKTSSNVYSGFFSNIDYDKDFGNTNSKLGPGSSGPGSSGPGSSGPGNTNIKDSLETSFIGIEYFGYFKPDTIGNYSFTIDAGQDFCLMWLGNKAVCEYVVSNADIKSSNMEFKQTVLEDSHIPIRLQYFASKQRDGGIKVNQNKRTFSIIVKNNDNNKTMVNSECFKTIKTKDNNIYFPKFIYSAFASALIDDFKQGKFVCYSFGYNDESESDYNMIFSYMKENKRDIFKGKYDAVVTDGLSISEYGTLPNGINFTDAFNASTTVPSKLSVYRIHSDIRMGRSFQVNKTKSNGRYAMSEISKDLLSLTNDQYTEFPNYYSSKDSVNTLPATPVKSINECLEKCNNVDASKCSYFYTYNNDNKQFCVTGTNYSSPLFNQIPGKNESNGSLFIRGNKTSNPTIKECIAGKKGGKYSSVSNTIDYTASNPYYNYTISKDTITDFKKLGDCNDPAVTNALSEYGKRKKEAEEILYNDEEYRSDGYYMKSPGIYSKPNYGELSGDFIKKVPGYKAPGIEPFETDMTDATQDTGKNITKLRSIQQSLQQKENAIHENKQKISDDLIPTFTKTRDILKDDNKYDYNGDVLMYLKDTKIPSKDEQRLIDSSDERFNQGSMYSLGIITAATLIILAICLGRD